MSNKTISLILGGCLFLTLTTTCVLILVGLLLISESPGVAYVPPTATLIPPTTAPIPPTATRVPSAVTPIAPTATPREPSFIEERGWIEIMFTGTVKPETPGGTQLDQTLLFHGPGSRGEGFFCTGCYVLELLPDAQIKVPPEDRRAGGITVLSGKDHEYLVKGTVSQKRLESGFLSHVPILQVIFFERIR